jgi:phosphoglycerol transferase MdoB-like AlkP superfamily enzyme
MESFGSYWTQYQQPEFDLMGDLKKDFAEDFVTLKTLSGTGSTVGSLSSLIAGVPQKTTSEFLPEGPYLNVPFRTAPAAIFKKAGYKTRFVYGGNPGWRDMNKYAHTQSFDSIEGEHDIEKALSPKVLEHHDWGIYDEDVWEYLWQTLQSATDPQFILTMTTSNHPPYQLPSTYVPPALTIPAEVKNRLLGDAQNALLRFKAFRYSNQKLSEFLNRIKNSSLKDKVVIAVTGDHTFWVVNFAETEYLEKGSVPFFLYSGRHHHSAPDSVIFASHSDIPVTLYEEALSEAPYYSFNKSIFDPSRKNLAVTAQPFVVDDKGAVMLFPGDLKRRTYFSWDPQYKELKVTEPRPELDPMAIYYQSFMGSLDYFFFSEKKRMHDANFGR